MADRSAELMTTLFTELKDSVDIYLLPPSRKGLKRIPADPPTTLPPPHLPNLKRRVKQNVADVARAGLLHRWAKPGVQKRDLNRHLDVVMEKWNISSASEARVFFMKRELKLESA